MGFAPEMKGVAMCFAASFVVPFATGDSLAWSDPSLLRLLVR
jgi:hypothetical protein